MYRTILVPLDGSELAEHALPIAENLAKASGARLVLLRVDRERVTPEESLGESIYEAWSEAEKYLDRVAEQVGGQGLFVEKSTEYGDAVQGILAEIERSHADLVVMCTHGRTGLARVLYGSVAAEVFQRSPAPVLLVRAGAAEPVRNPKLAQARILVSLDGSAFGETVLPAAADLARTVNGTLVLLRSIAHGEGDAYHGLPATEVTLEAEEREPKEYLAQLSAGLQERDVAVETMVRVASSVDEAILGEVRYGGAAMLAMAVRDEAGLGRLKHGSVEREVLRCTLMPVLLVGPATHPKDEAGPTDAAAGVERKPQAA